MSGLRVTIVNRHLADGPGGSELQCDLIARGLAERGHDVTYVVPYRRRHGPTRARDLPYTVVAVSQRGRAIAQAVLAARPDVVYWRFNKRSFRPVARRLAASRVPLVFAVAHVHDILPWAHKPLGGSRLRGLVAPVLRIVGRWQHGGMRHVAAMTTNRRDLLDRLRSPVREWIPNGMTADSVDFAWPRPHILWVGALKAAKRPEACVALARELDGLNVDVLMVGPVQSPGYEGIVDGSTTPDNLHHLGAVEPDEVNGMFASALLHVHTCLPEGFSNVFIQAWMQGCPSVSLGYDPDGHLVRDRVGADAGDDPAVFAAQVRRYLEDDALRAEAGERARRLATDLFGVDTMVDRVEALLRRVASR